MLATATAQADRLVVGVDANAAGMATASRRAAARPARGGLPNVLFVVAAAEALPAELDGVADLVTVHFPWGSLLRGLLGADPAIMAGLTRVLRPGAVLQLLLSSTDRDRGVGVAPIQAATLHALAGSYATWGLAVTEVRPATVADVTAVHSTWGKRLGAGTRRLAWMLRARSASPAADMQRSGGDMRDVGHQRSWGLHAAMPHRAGHGGHRAAGGIEWEDDMVEVDQANTSGTMHWRS